MSNILSKPILKCPSVMEQLTNKLNDLVGEKYIAEEILNLKYAMEHKEKMNQICDSFKNMTCVILNTVSEEPINDCPIQTHLIFYEKFDLDDEVDNTIERYVFSFQIDELDQYKYINDIIEEKGNSFLNLKEYVELYNISRNLHCSFSHSS